MSDYEIIITQAWEGYIATLKEYDGESDTGGPESFFGVGATEQAAEDDLEQQLSDYEQDRQADLGDYLYEQMKDRRSGL